MVQKYTKKVGLLLSSLLHLFKSPRALPSNMRKLASAWKNGGLPLLKRQLLTLGYDPTYTQSWLDYQHRVAHALTPQLRHEAAQIRNPVTISILVPTYNTQPLMLKAMLDSVKAQVYTHWELCIADDASTSSETLEVLKAYAAQDKRIKLHLSQENQGVSHASNHALALATSPFCVLLDHDDLLMPQAIYRVALSVMSEDPDMLYSDEVMVCERAINALQFLHRPAFSPEYLRHHPYIVHMVGFKTSLLREIGGFDESLKISQDYDLILRASEKSQTIVHIPEVLYQWRTHAASAGHQKMEQVSATTVSLLQKHLERTHTPGQAVEGPAFNFYSMQYAPQPGLKVAIVIPTKNYGSLVRQCIESLQATIKNVDHDIILIDHESTDADSIAYFDSLKTSGQATVLRYVGPFNFSSINNWAVKQIEGPYTHYLFCNNDIQALDEGWLEHMLGQCQDPSVGMVGAQLLYPDGESIQHAGVLVGAYGIAEHYAKFFKLPPDRINVDFMGRLISAHEVSAVTAACLLMRKEAFDAVKGYDEALAVGFGDVDLCLRTLEQGWRILYCPEATLIHHESISRGKATDHDPHPEDSALFSTRWRQWLDNGDPYFNPAFTLHHMWWQRNVPMACNTRVQRRIFRRQEGKQHLSLSPVQDS